MDNFNHTFRNVEEQLMGTVPSQLTDSIFLAPLEQAIGKGSELLESVARQNTNMLEGALKGFLAEAHHAASFNIDAARQGISGLQAEVLDLRGPAALGSPDIRIHTPTDHLDFQSKMYATAEKTADQLSNPSYQNMGLLAPAEQVEAIKQYSADSAHTYHSSSPQEATAFQHTATNVDSKIQVGGASSRPISSDELMQMAKEAKAGNLDPKSHGYSLGDTLTAHDVANQAIKGGATAAVIGFTIRIAPHIWTAIQNAIENGEFSRQDLERALKEGGKGVVEGAIRGAVAGGLVTACKAGFLGSQLQSVDPIGIGAATSVGISAIRDGFLLARGEISGVEFADRTARNGVTATAGVIGAGIGQALIPIPILGAMIGNLIGAMVGSLGYEGAKALFRRIINEEAQEALRELGQNQIRLAESVLSLLSSIQVVGERLQGLVVIQQEQVRRLALASDAWAAQSEFFRNEVHKLHLKNFDIQERSQGQQARFRKFLQE